MHASVMAWLKEKVAQYELKDKSVLEVGSLNFNGSARDFFSGPYIGMDRLTGKGVDVVADAHKIPYEAESFDVVVSTEMLEHDEAFWLSMKEMGRVLRKNGLLMVTARGNGFPKHFYPHDFYRFMPDIVPELAALAGCMAIDTMEDPECPGVLFVGWKCS